jgi:hypothetical protein
MRMTSALTPAPIGADRRRLADLDAELARREGELAAFKDELRTLQTQYLRDVGALYARLTELEAAIVEAEVRAGLRPPPEEADDAAEDEAELGPDGTLYASGCSNRGAPSDGLKRMFRDLAKTIHPDLALDEPARCRRHSLMAEANRAYAERDEDRLRLILQAWHESPDVEAEAALGDDEARAARRAAVVQDRLVAIEAEFADLRRSAIAGLQRKVGEARSQGWDLMAEMVLQVKREVARATARLAQIDHRKNQAGPIFTSNVKIGPA